MITYGRWLPRDCIIVDHHGTPMSTLVLDERWQVRARRDDAGNWWGGASTSLVVLARDEDHGRAEGWALVLEDAEAAYADARLFESRAALLEALRDMVLASTTWGTLAHDVWGDLVAEGGLVE